MLAEDDYVQIKISELLAGDIVLYVRDGDIEHSGIVVEIVLGMGPRILSKWGGCHEVIHMIGDCPTVHNRSKVGESCDDHRQIQPLQCTIAIRRCEHATFYRPQIARIRLLSR